MNMKIAKLLLLTCVFSLNFSVTSYASEKTNLDNMDIKPDPKPDTEVRDERVVINNDYDANYYEDEGRLVFRAKLNGVLSKGVQNKLSNDYSSDNRIKASDFIRNGYGGELSTTIFFHNNFAADLSLGVNVYRVNGQAIKDISSNYFKPYGYIDYTDKNNPKFVAENAASFEKTRNITSIPVTALFQFHVAPFGAIRPYVGIGVGYNYLLTYSKEFELKPGFGIVGQVGVDFVLRDDTFISLDVKMSKLNPKIKYKPSVVGYNGNINSPRYIENLVRIDPIIFSLGVGYKF